MFESLKHLDKNLLIYTECIWDLDKLNLFKVVCFQGRAGFYYCPTCFKKVLLILKVWKIDFKIIINFPQSKYLTHPVASILDPLAFDDLSKIKCLRLIHHLIANANSISDGLITVMTYLYFAEGIYSLAYFKKIHCLKSYNKIKNHSK
jgi:hypothetical protein